MGQGVAYEILNHWKIIKSSAKKDGRDRLPELVFDERFQLQGLDEETFGGFRWLVIECGRL